MPDSPLPVLSTEQLDKLNRAERMIHDLLPLFDVANECGVECQTMRQQLKEMQDQIAAIRKNFT